MLEFERVNTAQVENEPFPFTIIPGVVSEPFRAPIEADYPAIARYGSFPLPSLSYGPAFAQLIGELTGDRMRGIVEKKFAIDLSDRPVMATVRGQCTARDGNIHTDSATKLITMLFYTNRPHECASARLRLLRSRTNLDDYAAEVPAEESTLVIFRNGPNAWHGFAPFHGQRRVIQVNWVTDASVVAREQARHRVSAFFKRLVSPGPHAAAH
ncbi:MAG TPA: 2OG-Fe(II) oxygenase [Rhizomicrobium sp.]|nr:2OG-Fe(II) oxygenase [Rhizomicrobium sp.]